jgi:hypothetical protein
VQRIDISASISGDANSALSALTLQIYEGQLSEREHRPLLQESIGVGNPLSQHHSGMARYICVILFEYLPRTTNRPLYQHLWRRQLRAGCSHASELYIL